VYYGTLSTAQLKAYGQQVAAHWQVPWPIFDAMIQVESGWSTSPSEVSSTGAQGIAQIEPGTAAEWQVNPWDPFAALDAAAQHLSEYYSDATLGKNNWANALAMYNGGASAQGIANSNRGGYASKVLSIAGQSGDSTTAPAGSSASAPSSNPYVSPWMPDWMKNALQGIAPATAQTQSANQAGFLQSIHDLPFGIGPGMESIVSAGIVGSAAAVLVLIGGIWLILGNQSSRSVVVQTAKTAAKAAAA
jgi:Transglycosylase SLT domain